MPVDGRSMQPTLNPDTLRWGQRDWVLVDKLTPALTRSVPAAPPGPGGGGHGGGRTVTALGRGDVVVMTAPFDPDVTLVKRVVGLPGDVVRVRRGAAGVGHASIGGWSAPVGGGSSSTSGGSSRGDGATAALVYEGGLAHDDDNDVNPTAPASATASAPDDGRPAVVRVPRGFCWVESDESFRGVDSNAFGPASLGLVRGR
ncbi:hypothetical protein HK405_005968, partial [Cladochytrium tenue]